MRGLRSWAVTRSQQDGDCLLNKEAHPDDQVNGCGRSQYQA